MSRCLLVKASRFRRDFLASSRGLSGTGETPTRVAGARKVNVRLPGKWNSNSQGARPVRLILTIIKWIRTNRLSIKNSLCSWSLFHRISGLRVQGTGSRSRLQAKTCKGVPVP